MLKAHIENNEVISSGKVCEDDIYIGFCCKKFEWKVIMADTLLVWGECRNQNCPVNANPTGWYQGVSAIDPEKLELWLAEENE